MIKKVLDFINVNKSYRLVALLIVISLFSINCYVSAQTYPPQTETGGVGLEGKVSVPPPTQAPTITAPSNGAVFATLPITVTGFCPNGLMVKLFKNNVFSGSVMCNNGSYSIQTDLFSASNQLIVRAYDALDQASPDSNKVTITFHDSVNQPNIADRVVLTSNYARRGANPTELLTWPIMVSGGTFPYAISVDWGDGSSNDLQTVTQPGEFTIKHRYEQAGVFRVLVKASDKNGVQAFLQLVAIGNGKIDTSATAGSTAGASQSAGVTDSFWLLIVAAIPLMALTFWLGKSYGLARLKRQFRDNNDIFK